MSIRVIITKDFDQMSHVAADIVKTHIADTIAQRGDFTLGLATGNSPTGMYKVLAKHFNNNAIDAGKVTSFNLDEYVGLPGENTQARALHKESYSYFMIQELFALLRNKFKQTNVPWGCLIDQEKLMAELKGNRDDWAEQGADKGKAIVIDPKAKSDYLRWIRNEVLDAYEAKIKRHGGIDLHVIGVGGRGHVAFHESGIPFADNKVLLVKLDENTVANAVADGHFAQVSASPQYAISMGAELVYQAKCVLLLANGARKAEPVAASLAEDPTDAVPISYGQTFSENGGEMIYVIDQAAATDVLARRAEIEKRGVVIEDLSGQADGKSVADITFTRDANSGLLG